MGRELWLMRRTKRRYAKHGMILEYELPDVGIWLAEPAEIAAGAAMRMRDHIQRSLSAGRDAAGRHYTIDPDTHRARLYDRNPPKTSRSSKPRYTKTGRLSKRQRRARWPARYPAGGSKGERTFFVDSGYLRDNLTVEVSGASAYVTVPKERVLAINAIEKRGIYPLGIAPAALEAQLQEELNRCMETFEHGGGGAPTFRRAGIGRLVGGAALRGILRGLSW